MNVISNNGDAKMKTTKRFDVIIRTENDEDGLFEEKGWGESYRLKSVAIANAKALFETGQHDAVTVDEYRESEADSELIGEVYSIFRSSDGLVREGRWLAGEWIERTMNATK